MFIEIDPSMSSKLIPYLLKRLKGHAETITEDRDFRTFDELKNCFEKEYKKKIKIVDLQRNITT